MYSVSFIFKTFSSLFRPKSSKTVFDNLKISVMDGFGWNGEGNVSKMKESLYLLD